MQWSVTRSGLFVPAPLDYSAPEVRGRFRPRITGERRIDWASDTAQTILRKIHSADGSPVWLDEIGGIPVLSVRRAPGGTLVGPPGEIIAHATAPSVVPRSMAQSGYHISDRKDRTRSISSCRPPLFSAISSSTYGGSASFSHDHSQRDVPRNLVRRIGCGRLRPFQLYNGAMGTDQCRRLTEAVLHAPKPADARDRSLRRA